MVTGGERGGLIGYFALVGRDQRRAFLWALPLVGTIGVVDTIASGFGTKTVVWAVWLLSLSVLASRAGRSPTPPKTGLGFLTSILSMAAVLGLALLSGGSQSIFFFVLVMVPLMTGLVAPGDLHNQGLQGLIAVGGGVGVLLYEGAPFTRIVSWSVVVAIGLAFALVSSEALRRRQVQFLSLERERADALEKLAEAERLKADAERWAAAGYVADQVAHDVNSPLAAIRSSLHFALEELEGGRLDGTKEAIDDCSACVERIHVIVSDLSHRIGRVRGNAREP